MQIELTPEMVDAILVALDELSNSGDWIEFYDEGEYDIIARGIAALRNLGLEHSKDFVNA